MDGFYTVNDFKEKALGIFNGSVPDPRKWEHRFDEFKNLTVFQQRNEIELSYKLLLPYILQRKGNWINPYILDWNSYLNTNEFSIFCVCRCLGVALYPQYKVGRFYLDFANPYYKIGVEVDSKTYHIIEKDIERDKELKSLGWKIYHLTSSECYSNSKQNMEEIDLEYDYLTREDYILNRSKQLKNTMEGIIESIAFCSLGHSIEQGFEEVARLVAYEHLLLR